MRSDLPLLTSIEIAAPCPMSWAKMQGNDTKRYCDSCRLHVHDLSAMTSQEAEALLQAHQGELCVRYTQDSDGRILTDEFPTPLRPLRSLLLKHCATVAAFVILLLTTGIHNASAETKPASGKAATKKSVKKAPQAPKAVLPAIMGEPRTLGKPTTKAVPPPILGVPVIKPALENPVPKAVMPRALGRPGIRPAPLAKPDNLPGFGQKSFLGGAHILPQIQKAQELSNQSVSPDNPKK